MKATNTIDVTAQQAYKQGAYDLLQVLITFAESGLVLSVAEMERYQELLMVWKLGCQTDQMGRELKFSIPEPHVIGGQRT